MAALLVLLRTYTAVAELVESTVVTRGLAVEDKCPLVTCDEVDAGPPRTYHDRQLSPLLVSVVSLGCLGWERVGCYVCTVLGD